MVPKHIYEGTDFKTNPANNTPIGTGPFMFKEWQKGSFIQLVKNPNYHVKGKPNIDEIYWHVIPDAAARSVAFETGKVDVLPGGSVENFDVPRLSKLQEHLRHRRTAGSSSARIAWLWLNNRAGPDREQEVPPGDDVRDRPRLRQGRDLERPRQGRDRPVGARRSSSTPTTCRNIRYDPAKAKALLKEAGYKGEKVRLLPLPYGETWQRWAEAVKQNLQDVGINVEMVATDVARLEPEDRRLGLRHRLHLSLPVRRSRRSASAATTSRANIAKGSPFNNVEGYSNPEIDKLFADGAIADAGCKRQEIYAKAQKILVEDVPVAWMLELQFPTITRCKSRTSSRPASASTTASATPGSTSNRRRAGRQASGRTPAIAPTRSVAHDFLHRPADREGRRRPARDRRPELLPDPAGAGRSGAGDGGRGRRQRPDLRRAAAREIRARPAAAGAAVPLCQRHAQPRSRLLVPPADAGRDADRASGCRRRCC